MPHLVLIYERFTTVCARLAEIRREYKAATEALAYWRAEGHTGQEVPYLEVVAALEAEFAAVRSEAADLDRQRITQVLDIVTGGGQ